MGRICNTFGSIYREPYISILRLLQVPVSIFTNGDSVFVRYDAGANIIQENMRLGDELQVNSDVAGKVVHAIFGFCDIRNFTDCTEVS
jgi:hypothetical protein